jgi:hypothetical protein
MAGAPEAGVEVPGVGAVHPRQGAPDPVGIPGGQDQVHVIGHQDPGPDADPGRPSVLGQKLKIVAVVAVDEEGPRAPVAALRDVVGEAGKDGAGKTGHNLSVGGPSAIVN